VAAVGSSPQEDRLVGITASYAALDPEQLAALEADPERALAYFYGIDDPGAFMARQEREEAEGTRFDLRKDWHALHFLLTGDHRMEEGLAPPPLGNVVLGGRPTRFEATYGHVRVLDVDEVAAVATALEAIPVAELASRFSATELNARRIYPQPRPGGWDDRQIESLWEAYPRLTAFFRRAATAGKIVLLSTD
jgi:hypothetical protein